MNFVGYESGSDEERQPKKIKIEYQRNYKPVEKKGLLELLGSVDSSKGVEGSLENAGRTVGSTIDTKAKTKDQKAKSNEEFDFFSIETRKKEQILGPFRPSPSEIATASVLAVPSEVIHKTNANPKPKPNEHDEIQKLTNKKYSKINLVSISVKDQVDPYTPKPIVEQSLLVDDAFKNLDSDPMKFGNNSIMALAQQAKLQSSEFEQRKAERRELKKMVRQKYGF
jgi:hypothetical protein